MKQNTYRNVDNKKDIKRERSASKGSKIWRERERESERLSKRKIVIFFRPSVSLIGEQVKVVKNGCFETKRR